MKHLTKRILSCFSATVLMLTSIMTLVGCDQSSVFGDEGETMSPTYSCEYYEEVFEVWRQIEYSQSPEVSIDEYEMYIGFHYTDYGLSEEDKAIGKVKTTVTIRYANYDDASQEKHILWANLPEVADSVSFNELKSSFPQDAVLSKFNNSFTLLYDEMDRENRAKACKIFYDAYLEKHPDALEGLNIEPY